MATPTVKHIASFILQNINSKQKPLIVGISGPQGSGKSFTTELVAQSLRSNGLGVVEFSLDDVYSTHDEQLLLRATGNPLVYNRGLPGTHDIQLCQDIFQSLKAEKHTELPSYDKSLFQGEGDRAAGTKPVDPPYDVILFEGWMVGFVPLSDAELESRRNASIYASQISLENLKLINSKLADYETKIWSLFDLFVQLEAKDLKYIYQWRQQQENHLIQMKGTGMTPQQVARFVDGYMPAYELYEENLRRVPGLHIKLNLDRAIEGVTEIQK